jgi:N-acetylmuramoyl-L-alanine amidase
MTQLNQPDTGDPPGAVDSLDDIDSVDESQPDADSGITDSTDDTEEEDQGEEEPDESEAPAAQAAAQPKTVGQGDYVIGAGDCLYSVAFEHGFLWKTLWDLPQNADLKQQRKDPALLLEGDQIFIPPIKPKKQSAGSDAQYRYRLKGVPAKLRLKVVEEVPKHSSPPPPAADPSSDTLHVTAEDPVVETQFETKPRANAQYQLIVGAATFTGSTDGDGILEHDIPPNAREGKLIIEAGTPQQMVVPLNLGQLGPLGEISGIKQRLANLGFDCGDTSPQVDDTFAAALAAYQETAGLDVNGKLDDATRSAIESSHGA